MVLGIGRRGGGNQLMLQAGRWGKVWRGGKVERCWLVVESTLK